MKNILSVNDNIQNMINNASNQVIKPRHEEEKPERGSRVKSVLNKNVRTARDR